jgi:para-aminobenzoate synthetase component I
MPGGYRHPAFLGRSGAPAAYPRPVEPDVDSAVAGGRLLTGLAEVTSDVAALDGGGLWAVVLPFDAPPVCARFLRSEPAHPWPEPAGRPRRRLSWATSLDREAFSKRVALVREAIAAGDVYQVNVCRTLSTPLPEGFDPGALAAGLARRNPAPHAAVVNLPSAGVTVVSASPERFLRREGDTIESEPIKGTAPTAAGLSAKDRAENVMITDLVRNDLGRVCRYGSVQVPSLCRVEHHPGLVHLVSTVRGRLRRGTGWPEILAATFPPGSVTGAPKRAALEMIRALEAGPRGVYCGAVGWVDADRRAADLNVAIRTFWVDDGALHLGTGGGITWDSTADREWEETELKAARLLDAAARW